MVHTCSPVRVEQDEDCQVGSESIYLYSYFWNQARIEKEKESRIMTVKIPFREEIKLFQDHLLDIKRER